MFRRCVCLKALITKSKNRSFTCSSSFTQRLQKKQGVNEPKLEHVTLTAGQYRQSLVSPATVKSIKQVSSSVKTICLDVHDKKFSFKAGQWIDLMIPDLPIVGGFSMWSTPDRLTTDCCIDLAVKYSEWPPTRWLHTQCEVGRQLSIRAGGDFYYDENTITLPHDVLLIAGGVGINPLASILQHCAIVKHKSSAKNQLGNVILLFSARSRSELLFKEMFDKISAENTFIKCKYFVSEEILDEAQHLDFISGRITPRDVEGSLNTLHIANIKAYICGPPPMITDMENILLQLGVNKKQIFYEKWW